MSQIHLAGLRASVLALILLAPLAADAQVGRLLDRARRAATETVQTAPAQATQSARASAGSAAAAVVPAGDPLQQPHPPTPDLASMLAARFYTQTGHIGFEGLRMQFPRTTQPQGTVEVRRADGTLVGQQALGTATISPTRAFADLGLRSRPTWTGDVTDGDYTLDLVVDGQLVGRMPYTVRAEAAADAYAGGGRLRRVAGPWQRLGLLHHEVDEGLGRTPILHAVVWVNAADVGGARANLVAEITRADGTVVATSRPQDYFPAEDWTRKEFALERRSSTASRTDWFTAAMMTPGPHTLTVRTEDGRTVRSFPLTGTAGGIVPHPRSSLDHEPRHEILAPRHFSQVRYWVEVP